MTVDSLGDIWVSEVGSTPIAEYSANGTLLRTMGSSGTGNGQFSTCESLAVDSSGNVWAADYWGKRVEEFNHAGIFVQSIATGQLNAPQGIYVDAAENIWIADANNYRIAVYGSSGTLERNLTMSQSQLPFGLTLDSSGDVWVTDLANDQVLEYGSSGNLLTSFGKYGFGNGQFHYSFDVAVKSLETFGSLISRTAASRRYLSHEEQFRAGQFACLGGDRRKRCQLQHRKLSSVRLLHRPDELPDPCGHVFGVARLYGTYDMGGDVLQWNDTVILGRDRVARRRGLVQRFRLARLVVPGCRLPLEHGRPDGFPNCK